MSLEHAWNDDPDDRKDRLARRRAVEALRSGVPNSDAVIALGSGQSDIEDKFTGLLHNIARPGNGSGGRASMLVGAGFGQGKSHLLTHLGQLATFAGFVVSTVVISKETPLHDPAKVFRAAVESAVAPDGARDVVAEAGAKDAKKPRAWLCAASCLSLRVLCAFATFASKKLPFDRQAPECSPNSNPGSARMPRRSRR